MHTRWARLRLLVLVLFLCAFIHVCSFIGLIDILRQESFSHFTYPLETDLIPVVKKVRKTWQQGKDNSLRFDVDKKVKPITLADFSYRIRNKRRCASRRVDILVLVKSAVDHEKHRTVLRRTWMNTEQYRRSGLHVCTVFLLGIDLDDGKRQKSVQREQSTFGDLVQFNFVDAYFNNTYKTMLGFRWAIETLPQSRFLFFTDDDYFVNMWNLWDFVRSDQLGKSQAIAGFIWDSSMPKRYRYSKWHISIEEYPYMRWPRYPTAGSYVLRMDTAMDIYIGMHFTKYLRFDDVFIGIVAYKLNIPTIHNTSFFGSPLFPIDARVYKNVIACHMLSSPDLVMEAWRTTMKKGGSKLHSIFNL